MSKLMHGQQIVVALPTSCIVDIAQKPDEPDIWTIIVRIRATDVVNGEPNVEFKTKWQGQEPTRAEVLNSIMIMLRHEIQEQLGLKPHGGK